MQNTERFQWNPGDLVIESDRPVAKFDIDQPRDDHGRFGSGGGASRDLGDSSEHGAGEAATVSAEAERATDEAGAAYRADRTNHERVRALNARAAELHTRAGELHTAAGDHEAAHYHYEMASRHGG